MKIQIKDTEKQLIAVLVFLLITSFFYIKGVNNQIKEASILEQKISYEEEQIKPFIDIALVSKSFAVYDTQNKNFLYKVNAEKVLPLASLAKIMSVIVAMENLPEDHIFTIQKEALSEVGDNGLLVGEKWGRDELLKYSLIVSSNDAMYQIAYDVGIAIDPLNENPKSVFIEQMNQKAKELNLKSMEFFNESGLDLKEDISKNGAYGSARDVAKLFAYAIENYPDIFSITSFKNPVIKSFDKEHTAENTNPFVEEINGIIASKTGFTNISGGNLAIALNSKNNAKMVVVVLGSTFSDRFNDIKELSNILIN